MLNNCISRLFKTKKQIQSNIMGTTMVSAFIIVCFTETNEVELLPSNWLKCSDNAYWPPFRSTGAITKAVRDSLPPGKDPWTTYKIRVICICGKFLTNTGYAVLGRYWASTNKSVLARYRTSNGPVPGRYCKMVPGQYKYGEQNRTRPVLACSIGPSTANGIGPSTRPIP